MHRGLDNEQRENSHSARTTFKKTVSNNGGIFKLSHLLEGDPICGEDVVAGHVGDKLPVLSAAPVLHRDGLDEAVVLVHGEDFEGRVAPHVLVDDERARLLEGAGVRVGVEGLLVDLKGGGEILFSLLAVHHCITFQL